MYTINVVDKNIEIIHNSQIITTINLDDEFPWMCCYGQWNKLPVDALCMARNGNYDLLMYHLNTFLVNLAWFNENVDWEKAYATI